MIKRDFLKIIGGGLVLAATPGCNVINPSLDTARKPWSDAGSIYKEPRMRALSYAILCPNPHNRQPWKVDLSVDDQITVYADTDRLLPHTDPYARQITIGLGCLAELMVMAASDHGWDVRIEGFPEGSNPEQALDERPVLIAHFVKKTTAESDPLFAQVLHRRSNKTPYALDRKVADNVIESAIAATLHGSEVNGSNAEDSVERLRKLTHDALLVEIETPRTYKESVDLFRIGKHEIEKNPDGISFSGRLFETLSTLGMFSREAALDRESSSFSSGVKAVTENANTAMAHIWMVTPRNTRLDQLNAGRDWMRIHLATTAAAVSLQPLSQALQEFPEMADLYNEVHKLLAPNGGTVQMLARLGYAESVEQSPRWPLGAKVL